MAKTVFYKFHGTGNDFIMVDDRNNSFPVSNDLISRMCDRHFGIGADGLILLREKKGWDFEMVYFNSDGKESTMCGNGGRCIIAFADFLSLCGPETRFRTSDGEHLGVINNFTGNTWQIRLKMADVNHYQWDGDNFMINTGSPHYVNFTKLLKDFPVVEKGREIRYSEKYREEGINVNFVEWKDDELHVRTYERGVENETLSCGTGVTASSLAYALRNDMNSGKIPLRTLGGILSVYFTRQDNRFTDIWLEGPAKMVFSGSYMY